MSIRVHIHNDSPTVSREVTRREVVTFLLGIARRYPLGVASVVLLGLGVALTEGITIALLFPFLESIRGGGAGSLATGTPIGFLVPYFQDLSPATQLRAIAVALISIQLIQSAFRFVGDAVSQRTRAAIDRDLRLAVFDRMLTLKLGIVQKEAGGRLFTILNGYTGNTAQLVLALLRGIGLVAIFVVYLVVLVSISWALTLLAILLAVGVGLSMGALAKRSRAAGWGFNQAAIRLNHAGFESLSAMKIIRQFGQEDAARERFDASVKDSQKHMLRIGMIEAVNNPLFYFLSVLVVGLVIIASTFTFAGTAASAAILLTVLVVMFRMLAPASGINAVRTTIASQLPAVETVIAFLDPKDAPVLHDGPDEAPRIVDAVEFDHVSFQYDPADPRSLDNVSLRIPRGKFTAIVGTSGSGKSTLVNLLCRLYDPTSGHVKVDGKDLREFRSASWRRRLGVVSQDVFLLNASIHVNIRFSKPDASDEEVIAAAKLAHAHEFIEGFPEGYETQVGERGVRLSGGQAQRVAIARAILHDPEILIMDEATSALDAASERAIQQAVDQLSHGRTVVAIAHRLSTVRRADNIVVLEHGRVIEEGTHDALVAKRGAYWKFVNLQDLSVSSAPVAEAGGEA